MMADNVVVLDQGLIVETGTPQALYDRPVAIRRGVIR